MLLSQQFQRESAIGAKPPRETRYFRVARHPLTAWQQQRLVIASVNVVLVCLRPQHPRWQDKAHAGTGRSGPDH